MQTNKPRRLKAGQTQSLHSLRITGWLKELAGERNSRKSFATRAGYERYLDNWVLPRWGEFKLEQVKPAVVEEWLDGIKRARWDEGKDS